MKRKTGISLIILVITIVVIIILAAAVILNLGKNNPIDSARKAKIVQSLDTFKSDLGLQIANKLLKDTNLDVIDIDSKDEDGWRVVDLVPSIKGTEYESELIVVDGKLKLRDDSTLLDETKEIIKEALSDEVGMTIAQAKQAVTSYATLKQYIGTKITDYNPTAGGTWRIFYYDEAGEFGTAGKLYLKRDYVSKDKVLSSKRSYIPSPQGLEIMRAMNPKWRDYPTEDANTIDLENEHCVAWLCDPINWTDYKTSEADYAIGGPSVEMYMKAYNVWKTGNKDATNLICNVESVYGYSVGANNAYANSGYATLNKILEAGPNNIFMGEHLDVWWLASPSANTQFRILYISGFHKAVGTNYLSENVGTCPVVCI